jgi:hypothetical protein
MKCPHCRVEIHEHFASTTLHHGQVVGRENGIATTWAADLMQCPACSKAIIKIAKMTHSGNFGPETEDWLVYPRSSARSPAPPEVPVDLADDYNEAGAVLPHSAKASAALSRRCVQSLLRAQGYAQKDLAPAIQAVLDAKQLPSWLADNLDAIRNIGNFAAHPMKDSNTGAIMEVEPHEAEWNLEVLEGLFDFYYVQPAKDAAKRAAFNAKLQAAGKPPMK